MSDANRHSAGTVWLPTGNPDTTNITPTDFNSMGGQPGSLGVTFEATPPDRSYQRVQLDSGATAATPTGAVAANQVLYWKDKGAYLVTNDSRFALGGGSGANGFRNAGAGILRNAPTPGNFIDILQRGRAIPVNSDGTGVIGDIAVISTSTTVPEVTAVAAGTAPTTRPVIGVIRAVAVGANISVDVDMPNVQ